MSSKKLIMIVVVLAIIIAIPLLVLGRQRAPSNDPVVAMAHRAMTSDLRGLAMTQAATRQLTGRYGTDPDQMGHLSTPGVTVPVVTLADTGWTAVVTHKQIEGIRCGIGVYARNPLRRFARSGEVVCE